MTIKTKATLAIGAALLGGAVSVTIGAPLAAADSEAATTTLGQPAEVVNGAAVQSWTVTGLRPSSDPIPYPVRGTLWEAVVADTALRGEVKPIIPFFNARAADGESYRVLWEVATPQGVNPSTLHEGQTAAGKVYFDVTGSAPNSVVYNDGGQDDLAVWLPAPPAAPSGGGGGTVSAVPTATGPAETAPAETSIGTPLPAAAEGEGAEAGVSQGTPVGEGTPAAAQPATEGAPAATAAPVGSEGTPAAPPPAAASEGTSAAGAPAAASEGTSAAPAPAPSDGTVPIQ